MIIVRCCGNFCLSNSFKWFLPKIMSKLNSSVFLTKERRFYFNCWHFSFQYSERVWNSDYFGTLFFKIHNNLDITPPVTTLFGYNAFFSWIPNYCPKISVGLGRHVKFIYFRSYHRFLTKIFSLVKENRPGSIYIYMYCRI